MEVSVVKKFGGWVPDPGSDKAKDYQKKGKIGDLYHIKIARFQDQRNAKLNSKYWVLLKVAVENQDIFINSQQLHIRIKKVLGIVENVYNPITLAMEEEVGSTAFEKMDNETFNRYFNDALTFIIKYVVIGASENEILNRVNEILRFT